ncbi:MAG: CoA ester lyase [Gammaproteobacteria bacterium]|nr:CoA ester lyase [Gammaproteobacteria bacterium]
MSTRAMKRVRSFLFVPGNKASMIEKAAGAKADALILDLEDSVPPDLKIEARGIVASKLAWLAEQGQRVYVRINRSPHMYDFDDVLAVVGPHLEGVFISKPCGPEDVDCISMLLAEAEYRAGLAVGTTRVIPLLETARSMELCYEIARRERVAALVGATAKNADTARALGYVWSTGGRESLYFKSRVVMAARAANKLAIGGIWQQVHDLEGLRSYVMRDRELGMTGELLLHPSNVAAANETFCPTPDEIAYYQGMMDAHAKAQAGGRASCIYDGEHIDIAHVETAREIIALAAALAS